MVPRTSSRDLTKLYAATSRPAGAGERTLSTLARGLVGSEILKIASEIRAMQKSGQQVCNLTVGDFSSTEFRIPRRLEEGIAAALAAGQTNYPPSDGVLDLREAVARLFERSFGLVAPVESVLIAGGARPLIYAAYRAVLDPGETVVYPVPSWNNNHYAHLAGARGVAVTAGAESRFLPSARALKPHLAEARLLCVNTPLNPTGTVLEESEVRAIAELVVEENRRREAAGRRSLWLLWDQVYWMLSFGGARHWTPPELVPESAPYTLFVDGISKAFAATGLRVGWSVAPPEITGTMRDILGHVGAWAPRPEQVATARLLADEGAVTAYHEGMIREVRRRLDRLHEGFTSMAAAGLPVSSLPPQGAIYLSARFDLIGRRRGGARIATNEEIRRLLLEDAGFAVVPFQAFGLAEESGWMRLSVGAISLEAIDTGLERVRALLSHLG